MSQRRQITVLPACLALALMAAPLAASAQERFACTEVLGFSQSMEWFGGFSLATRRASGESMELAADSFLPTWQGRFTMGAAVEVWATPDGRGWQFAYVSQSACPRDAVDRVVFNVSGATRPLAQWVSDIRRTVSVIRARYPKLRRLVLEPVVGAPAGQCENVRAGLNHPVIVEAIRQVADGDLVRAGALPSVSDCSQFRDRLGHLTPDAARAVHDRIRDYYERQDAGR